MNEQGRQAVEGLLALFRAKGIRYEVMTDAAGELFIKPNIEDLRRELGEEAAQVWEAMVGGGPRPHGHEPPAA